jgi:HEAT repeat protein
MSEQSAQPEDLRDPLTMLARPDEPLSKRMMRAFSGLHSKQLATFQQAWRAISPERRVEAMRTFQNLAEDNVDLDFRDIFFLCLNDPEATVRALAVEGLWEDERPQTMRQLMALAEDPASEVRVAALMSLSRFAYRAELDELAPADADAVCTTLLHAASEPTQTLQAQRRAIEGLGYFADAEEAQATIERAYHHPHQDMRESALVAMGRSMRPAWIPTIERELHSPAPALRFAAAQAVGELGEDGEPLLKDLLPLVDDDDAEVAQAAIWALGQVGGPNGQRVLQRLARSKDETRRQAATEALEELMLDEPPDEF